MDLECGRDHTAVVLNCLTAGCAAERDSKPPEGCSKFPCGGRVVGRPEIAVPNSVRWRYVEPPDDVEMAPEQRGRWADDIVIGIRTIQPDPASRVLPVSCVPIHDRISNSQFRFGGGFSAFRLQASLA